MKKNPDILQAFKGFGETEQLDSITMSSLQHFICIMYGEPNVEQVNLARYKKLTKRSNGKKLKRSDPASLPPPCEASSIQQMK